MVATFKAAPPGKQQPRTHRQFKDIEYWINQLRRETRVLFDFILQNYAFAAHGTMFTTSGVTGPDIGTGWLDVDVYDSTRSVTRIELDPVTGEWTYPISGVYQVSLEMNLSHNESNAGRTFFVRLQDSANSSADAGVPVAVGRNQPGTNFAASFLQEIAVGDPVRTFRVQVGNGDALSSVIWEAVSVTIVNVGAWADDIPE